jgi:hypothetical protein
VKYWEIIADNLSKAGWSWGCVSAIDSEGRTIWIADAHRGDNQRFIVHADGILTAFLELEAAIRVAEYRTQLLTKSGLASQFALPGSHAERSQTEQQQGPRRA